MKVLVTGGTGFVGKHLVRQLINRGALVRMLVRKTSTIEECKEMGVEFVYGDITDQGSLRGIAKHIEIVYHLAGMGHVSATSKAAHQRSLDINVNGTKYLAEECSSEGVDKFIHFSSTAAMGLIKKPMVTETEPCKPSTPYQKTKYESEQVVEKYWMEHGLRSVILRPCMIYGVGGAGEFLKFCRLINRGFFPKIGRGRNLTPIVHVNDVVQAAILLLNKGNPGEVYLIASKESYELKRIRSLIAKYLPTSKPYFYIPTSLALTGAYCLETLSRLFNFTPVVTSKNISSTVVDRVFSIQKAKENLGYNPKVDLEFGIKETIKWYEDMGYL